MPTKERIAYAILLAAVAVTLTVCGYCPSKAATGDTTAVGPSFDFGIFSGAGGKATATRPRDRAIMEGFSGARIEVIPGSKKIRIKGGSGGHTIKNTAGNTMPTRTYLRYSSPFQVTDNAGANETRVSVPFANQTTAGLMQPKDKKKSDNYLDAKADFGCKGDDSTDDTACIFTAISTARTANKPLKFRDGRFKTNGGYLIDWPVNIKAENATFVLTADNTLLDISTNYATFEGIDIEVPDANTAAVVKITTSAARLQGRGWGPMRKVIWHNSRIYSASAANWDQTQGYDTVGNWTGIQLVADTTAGNCGIDFIKISDTYIEFPSTGIHIVKLGTGSGWVNGNMFTNIYIGGFTTGIKSEIAYCFGNEFSGISLHHVRSTAGVGLSTDGLFIGNDIWMNAWNDSGGPTQSPKSSFQSYNILGTGNILRGITEQSVATPDFSATENDISVNTWVTDTQVRSSKYSVGGPFGIGTSGPSYPLHIVKEYPSPSTSNIPFFTEVFGDPARFMFASANGTLTSPTKKLQGENYAVFGGRGYSGTAFPAFSPADIRFYADEDQDTGWGSGIKFITTPSGNPALTSGTLAMNINSAGRVIIDSDSAADDGVNRLQVDGTIKSATGGFVFPDSTTQTTAVPPLPSKTGNALKHLRVNSGETDVEWATIAAGLELSRVVTGGQTAQSGDSVVEFTATGSYAIPASLANKKSIVVSNTSASDTVSITAGASVTLVGGTYSLLAQTFVILGEDPDNIDTWRVVAVGSNGATDLSGYALLAGRVTPQQLNLGTASGASTGYISSTAHATKGKYFLNSAGTVTVDEVNTRFGIGTGSPSTTIDISASSGGAIRTVYTGASGASGSAGYQSIVDDGAAMAADDRLGYYIFGGATDGAGTRANSAAIEAFAESGFGAGSAPTYMLFKTAASGSTTRTERFRINSIGTQTTNQLTARTSASKVLTNDTSTSVMDIALADEEMICGWIEYCAHSTDGTDMVIHRGRVSFAATSKGGVQTADIAHNHETGTSNVATGGATYTDAVSGAADLANAGGWGIQSGTGKITLKYRGNASVTTTGYPMLKYTINLQGTNTMTPL